jgi:hypothetical protein
LTWQVFAEAFQKAGEIKKEVMDKKAIKISPDNQLVAILHERQPPRLWRGQEGSADRQRWHWRRPNELCRWN